MRNTFLIRVYIPAGPKKNEQHLYYNSVCLAVTIRLLFNPYDALWHRRKRFVIIVYFKMAPQGDNRVKVSAFFVQDTKWVRSQALSGCLAQPSTLSKAHGRQVVNRRAGSGRKAVLDRDSKLSRSNRGNYFFIVYGQQL